MIKYLHEHLTSSSILTVELGLFVFVDLRRLQFFLMNMKREKQKFYLAAFRLSPSAMAAVGQEEVV